MYMGHKMDLQHIYVRQCDATDYELWPNWIELNWIVKKKKLFCTHTTYTIQMEKRGHILIKRGCKWQSPFNNRNNKRPSRKARPSRLFHQKWKETLELFHIPPYRIQSPLNGINGNEISTRQNMSNKSKRINSMARNVNRTYSTIWALLLNPERRTLNIK